MTIWANNKPTAMIAAIQVRRNRMIDPTPMILSESTQSVTCQPYRVSGQHVRQSAHHTQPLGVLASAVENVAVLGADLRAPRIMMVVASSTAVPVLLLITALSVYKLRGMTPYGAREQGGAGAERDSESPLGTPRWVKLFGVISVILVLLFVVFHLAGNGLGVRTRHG